MLNNCMHETETVKHYRKLVGGGAIALVQPDPDEDVWFWRCKGMRRGEVEGTIDVLSHFFETAEDFAESFGVEIDPEFMANRYPVPNRREAIMATRRKLGL